MTLKPEDASDLSEMDDVVEREVIQVDRDAAAELTRLGGAGIGNGNKVIADEIKGGQHDNYLIVRLFTQHRTAELERLTAEIARMGEAAFRAGFHACRKHFLIGIGPNTRGILESELAAYVARAALQGE